MATSRRGKITEAFDLEAIEAQQKKVIGLIGEFVDVLNKVKPVQVGLAGAEKTKDVIDGMKAVSQATKEAESTSKALQDAISKLSEMSAKAKANYDALGNSLDDNIKKQLQYKIRLEEIKKALKDLEQFKGLGGQQIADEIAKLTKEELLLKQATTDVNATIRAQVKEINSNSNSIDEARAKLKQLRDARNAIDLTLPGGQESAQQLNAQIDRLDEFIKKNVDAYTQQKINIGNYQGSAKIIVDALAEVEKKLDALKEKQQGLQNLSKTDPIGFKFSNQADQLNQVNAELAKTEKEFTALNNITSNPQFFNLAAVGNARTEVRGFTTTLIELEEKGLGNTDFANELRKRLAHLTDQISDTRQEIKAMSSDSRAFDQVNTSVRFLTNSYQTFVGIQALVGDQNEETQKTIQKLIAVQAVANGLQDIAEQLTKKGTIVNTAYTYVQTQLAIATNASAAATTRLNAVMKLSTIGLVLTVVGFLVSQMAKLKKETDDTAKAQKEYLDYLSESSGEYVKAASQVGKLKSEVELARKGLISKESVLKEYNSTIGKTTGQVKNLNEAEAFLSDPEKTQAYIRMMLLRAAANIALQEAAKKAFEAERNRLIGVQAEQDKIDKKTGLKVKFDPIDPYGRPVKPIALPITEKLFADKAEAEKKGQKNIQDIIDNLFKQAGDIAKKYNFNFFDDNTQKDKNSSLEKDLKARFDLYKLEKERELELDERVIDEDTASYDQRLLAAFHYVKEKQKLILEEAEFEKSIGKKSNAEKDLIDKQAVEDQIKVAEDVEKKLIDAKKKTAIQVDNTNKFQIASYSSLYNELSLQIDLYTKKQQEAAAIEKKYHEERKERLKELGQELKNLVFDLLTDSIERQENKISDQMDLIDKRKEKEIEAINQTTFSEQEKNQKITLAEKRAQAEHEALDRKKRLLEVQRAKFERAKAIADIVQGTAIAVVNTLADKTMPAPVRLVLAGIVAAIGAAQLIRAIAQPLPHYKHGTTDHEGGLAVVGDGGTPEFVQTPEGDIYQTPAKDTLVELPKHSKVYKDEMALMDAMHRQHMTTTERIYKTPNEHYQFQNITDSISKMEKNVVKAIKDKPLPVFDRGGLKQIIHGNGSVIEYIRSL
jgi:hypothetical protein